MAYLIQGFFFYNHDMLDIAYRAESEGGAMGMVRKQLHRAMFAGYFDFDPNNPKNLTGELTDPLGTSLIFAVKITEKTLRFKKKYSGRHDIIDYSFKRAGNLWIGKWTGEKKSKGAAKCITTQVPDEFFFPPK